MAGPKRAERNRIWYGRNGYNSRYLYVPVSGWSGPLENLTFCSCLSGALTGRRESDIDGIAYVAIVLSAGIILTTIHTQDYKDAPGDAVAGRTTLPIAYPALSRPVTAFLLIAWSWVVSRTWRLDDITAAFMGVLSLIVGVNFIAWTDVRADIISSYLYNVSFHSPRLPERRRSCDPCQVWLCATYMLPLYYRLSFRS